MVSRISISGLLLLTLWAPPVLLAAGVPWCGTTDSGGEIKAAIHRDHLKRLGVEADDLTASAKVAAAGNVAVIQDNGLAVIAPNKLDLQGTSIVFTPAPRNVYKSVTVPGSLSAAIGTKVGLADDGAVQVNLPRGFSFPYFGKRYSSLFVNADGDITFGKSDAGHGSLWGVSDSDFPRFLDGPPRIAALFSDLDPSAATGNGGVYLLVTRTQVTVTWIAVPHGSSQGGDPRPSTFQVTLQGSGKITLTYGDLEALFATVGVSPGGGGALQLVDFTADKSIAFKTALAERFTPYAGFDDFAVGRLFLSRYADVYDHLIIFANFVPAPFNGQGSLLAYTSILHNAIEGIGLGPIDNRELLSTQQLAALSNMGLLSRYPNDPDAIDFPGNNSVMSLVAHEVGHRWLMYLAFRDANGEDNLSLLDPAGAHWDNNAQASASVLLGNQLQEQSANAYVSTNADSHYGPVDQYAMGLIPPEQVPPFFYVNLPQTSDWPVVGQAVNGNAVNVTIADVIAANGPRVPDSTGSPKHFKMAFILLTQGAAPSAADVAKVDAYSSRWTSFFAAATDGRASVSTQLVPR